MTEADIPAGGSWKDVPALHRPRRALRAEAFDRGVGSEGYDRHTGVEVPKHPMYRRPGEPAPAADPFGPGEHAET